MKLGGSAATPYDGLAKNMLRVEVEFHSDEEIEASKAVPLDDDEIFVFWEDARKAAQNRKRILSAANQARIERELTARFGVFKGVAMHPAALRLAECVGDAARVKLVGEPVLPLHAIVVILFMAQRGKMYLPHLVLLAALLFAVHPSLVFLAALACNGYSNGKKRQKPKRSQKRTKTHNAVGHLSDLQHLSRYDFIVVGAGLRGLYPAALLAKCGFTVAVLESSDSICAGSTVRPPNSPKTFIVEDVAFGPVARYDALLKAGLSAADASDLEWDPVGTAENGWTYRIQTSDDGPTVSLKAGAEAWVDSIAKATGAAPAGLAQMLQHAVAVSRGAGAFSANKLRAKTPRFPRLHALWAKALRLGAPANDGSAFAKSGEMSVAAAFATVSQCLKEALPLEVASLVGLAEEVLPPERAAFGAWCCSVAHALDGMHRPKGGPQQVLEGLARTVLQAGGHIFLNAGETKVFTGEQSSGVECAGARRATILSRKGVIVAVDAAAAAGVLSAVADKDNKEVAPLAARLVRTLIVFKGSCATLNVPKGIPILWQSCARQPAVSAEAFEWLKCTFRDDGEDCTCVVETGESAPKDWVLAKLAKLFPSTANNAAYVASQKVASRGNSHVPGRFGALGATPFLAGVDNVFLATEDTAAVSNAAGALAGGWLAAHAALGYDAFDVAEGRRNLASEVRNLA